MVDRLFHFYIRVYLFQKDSFRFTIRWFYSQSILFLAFWTLSYLTNGTPSLKLLYGYIFLRKKHRIIQRKHSLFRIKSWTQTRLVVIDSWWCKSAWIYTRYKCEVWLRGVAYGWRNTLVALSIVCIGSTDRGSTGSFDKWRAFGSPLMFSNYFLRRRRWDPLKQLFTLYIFITSFTSIVISQFIFI